MSLQQILSLLSQQLLQRQVLGPKTQTRSMQVDSELNIAHEWASVTQDLRRRLWTLHTANQGAQDDPEEAFIAWQKIINDNKRFQNENLSPCAPLVEFYYNEAKLENLD